MAKELSVKTEDKSLNDCDDSSSSQNTFSSLPHDQEQSTKTSISTRSFPQGKDSTSSEDLFVAPNDMAGDKAETKITSEQETSKLIKEDVQAVLSLEVPPTYYAHLAAFRARFYLEPEMQENGSCAGQGVNSTRAAGESGVRPLPALKENVKRVEVERIRGRADVKLMN